MPNIGTLLKEEITRLSRKEARSQVEPTKKASVQQRKDIAALKRQVAVSKRKLPCSREKFLVRRRGRGPSYPRRASDSRPRDFGRSAMVLDFPRASSANFCPSVPNRSTTGNGERRGHERSNWERSRRCGQSGNVKRRSA